MKSHGSQDIGECAPVCPVSDPQQGIKSNSLGLMMEEKGDLQSAAECFALATRCDPGNCEAWFNLGAVSYRLGNADMAETAFRAALRLNPGLASGHLAIGIVLQARGELRAATDYYQRALQLDSALIQAWYNLGIVLKEQGLYDGAQEACRKTVALCCDHADAHWNLALLLLLTGSFEEGWREFRWRFRKSGMHSGRSFPQPLWDGSPLQGRTILLHAEQGCGDTIQFVRYVPMVAARGGKVVLECQAKGLKRLLGGIPGAVQVVERGEELPDVAVQAALMDLPGIFGTALDSVPAAVPYLHADPSLTEEWRLRLSRDGALKIGLVWAGNKGHENDRNRSVPIELFSMLAELPDVSLFSLQVGEESVARKGKPAGLENITDLSPYLDDFTDTAACIADLDLVISVDTAVAHLAGALGSRIWTLIPFVPDWRWLLGRSDSPWYPTMRLFRQERSGEWQRVMEQVRDALFSLLMDRSLDFYRADRKTEAAACFERLLAACPDCAEAAAKLGYILQDLGRLEEAVLRYRQALHLCPASPEICNNLGTVLQHMGKHGESIDFFRKTLAINPAHLPAILNLGTSLRVEGRLEEAAALFRQALQCHQASSELRINLGVVLHDSGEFGEAARLYRQVLEQHPDNAEAHWNLALALLNAGDFEQGWQEYEWRWRKQVDPLSVRSFDCPLWDGSPLLGRTILIHCEQGLGDTIQFIRYAPLVAALDGTVLVECQHEGLRRILSSVRGISRVIVQGEALPAIDCHVPLLSLPRLFNTRLDTIPADVPYVSADPLRVEQWRQRLDDVGLMRVGLVWGGNRSDSVYGRRSCPPCLLAPFADIPGIAWFSLQMGEAATEIALLTTGLAIRDLTSNIEDFADTAAFIANLDLVVTVDTSVAHLAGSLGAPVWTLLSNPADWRWLVEREDSPWYPSMRLFRQKRQGDWSEVIAGVSEALAALITGDQNGGNINKK